jgi:hypothetical protein
MSLESNDFPDYIPTDSCHFIPKQRSPSLYTTKISVSINLKGSNPPVTETLHRRPKSSYNYRRPLNESSDSIPMSRQSESRPKQRSSLEVKFRVIPSPKGVPTPSSIHNKFLPFSSNKIIRQKLNTHFESKTPALTLADLHKSSSSSGNWICLPFPIRESKRIHSFLHGHSGSKFPNSMLQKYRVKKGEKENKVLNIRETYE